MSSGGKRKGSGRKRLGKVTIAAQVHPTVAKKIKRHFGFKTRGHYVETAVERMGK